MRKGVAFLTIVLTGCSAPEGSQQERFVLARPVTSVVADTVTDTVDDAWQTVQIPFEDLNLKNKDIPPALVKISDNPYALPTNLQCDALAKEVQELDVLLGPDMCTPANPSGLPPVATKETPRIFGCPADAGERGAASRKGEYVEQGAGFAKDRAVGIVSSKVNVIPFRGVVRKISGAEKQAKAFDRAYQAGRLRRAFLKGLTVSSGCVSSAPVISGPPAMSEK